MNRKREHNNPYFSFREYLESRFGDPLFRIPVDLGFGCPNRLDGKGGCSFCSEGAGRAQQITGCEDLEMQVKTAMSFARKRYRAKKFMAYFQAYSNTFADIGTMSDLYGKVLSVDNFTAISIGTRPDCLGGDVLEFITSFTEKYEVWVELGIQTIHDKTLSRINRGHSWQDSVAAINALHEHGIKVMAHVILGLPGESIEDMNETASRLSGLPVSAVKIHNLHIVKGTALEREYLKGQVSALNEHEYGKVLIDFLRHLKADMPVDRFITDTPPEDLVAPKWSLSKGQFEEFITYRMKCALVKQGDLFERESPAGEVQADFTPFKINSSMDGSATFWNQDYKEHFHSKRGAYSEAMDRYVIPSCLSDRLNKSGVRLLDICFGLGYNSLAAAQVALSFGGDSLEIDALELDKRSVILAGKQDLVSSDKTGFDWKAALNELAMADRFESGNVSIKLVWGDARSTITELSGKYEVVFLDAFSSQRNSELWTVDFFRRIKNIMSEDGVLLTYSVALPVRGGLLDAGFYVGDVSTKDGERQGTIAALSEEFIKSPIVEEELSLIKNTSRGIPYRDPQGTMTNKDILQNRQSEVVAFKNSHK